MGRPSGPHREWPASLAAAIRWTGHRGGRSDDDGRERIDHAGGHRGPTGRARRRHPADGTPGGSSRWSRSRVLTAFVVYSTWAAFVGRTTTSGRGPNRDLISPFFSPCVTRAACREPPVRDAAVLERLPALLILIFPLGFRLTCYYYRKAYYRGFWCPRRPARWPTPTPATAARPGFPDPPEPPPLLLLASSRSLQQGPHL